MIEYYIYILYKHWDTDIKTTKKKTKLSSSHDFGWDSAPDNSLKQTNTHTNTHANEPNFTEFTIHFQFNDQNQYQNATGKIRINHLNLKYCFDFCNTFITDFSSFQNNMLGNRKHQTTFS